MIKEGRELGAIRARVLRTYLRFMGWPLVCVIVLSMFMMQGSRNFNDW